MEYVSGVVKGKSGVVEVCSGVILTWSKMLRFFSNELDESKGFVNEWAWVKTGSLLSKCFRILLIFESIALFLGCEELNRVPGYQVGVRSDLERKVCA